MGDLRLLVFVAVADQGRVDDLGSQRGVYFSDRHGCEVVPDVALDDHVPVLVVERAEEVVSLRLVASLCRI